MFNKIKRRGVQGRARNLELGPANDAMHVVRKGESSTPELLLTHSTTDEAKYYLADWPTQGLLYGNDGQLFRAVICARGVRCLLLQPLLSSHLKNNKIMNCSSSTYVCCAAVRQYCIGISRIILRFAISETSSSVQQRTDDNE